MMMNFFKQLLISLALSFAFFSSNVFAGALPSNWNDSIDSEVKLKFSEKEKGIDKIKYYFFNSLLPFFKYFLGIISVTFILIYLFGILFAEGEEGQDEVKKKIYYSIFGFLLVSVSSYIPDIFNAKVIKEGKILDESQLKDLSLVVYNYLKIIVYAFATFMVIISGVKIINGSDEGEVDKEKLTVLYSIFGILLLFVAEKFVYGIFFKDFNTKLNQEAGVESAGEIVGIISFFMKYAAIAAIVFIILGGFYYIFSLGEEESETKGKTVVKNAIIGLLIIMTSYTILQTFLPGL